MSRLLEDIDEVLQSLSEAAPSLKGDILHVLKNIDPEYRRNWTAQDDRWNQACAYINRNNGRQTTSSILIYPKQVYKDGKESSDIYWVSQEQDGDFTLTTDKNKASKFSKNDFNKLKGQITDSFKKNIDIDPNLDGLEIKSNYEFEDVVETTTSTISDLNQYYYDLYSGKKYEMDVSSYWRKQIDAHISKTLNITNDNYMQLMIQGDTELLNALNSDEYISRLIYSLLETDAYDYTMLIDKTKLSKHFELSMIVNGCFKNHKVEDALTVINAYNRLKTDDSTYKGLLPNIKERLNSTTEEGKKIIFRKNLILTLDDISKNVFYQIMNSKGETLPEEIDNIEVEDLKSYIALKPEEIKSIANSPYIINEEEYKRYREENDLGLFLKNLQGKDLQLFEKLENNIFQVDAYPLKKNVSYYIGIKRHQKNLITENVLNAAKLFDLNKNQLDIENFFELDLAKNTFKVNSDLVINNIKVKELETTIDLEIIKTETDITIKSITFYINLTPKENEEEEETTKSPKESKAKISYEDAVTAIKQYLKDNNPKLLKKDVDVDTFWDKDQNEVRYEKMKKHIIDELRSNPTLYLYENGKIHNIKDTELEVLVDILNNELAEAKAKNYNRQLGSANISDHIRVDGNSFKKYANSKTPKEVAQKLVELAKILASDKDQKPSHITKEVKDQIDKDELANIIGWFNSRYGRNKSTRSGDNTPINLDLTGVEEEK